MTTPQPADPTNPTYGERTRHSQLARPDAITYGIDKLLALAERGILRIPIFQRQFVWDDKDILSLFDSIWRGFPIGTLLLWDSIAAGDRTVRIGSLTFEVPDTETRVLWVVDGQQRITTLVNALNSRHEVSDPRFRLAFDLRTTRFIHAKPDRIDSWQIPLEVMLESRNLVRWLREQPDELTEEDLDLADEVAASIRDYRIPAYRVGNNDEQLLRDVFDRVNSAGKPISRAQVFHALFGGVSETGSAAAIIESLGRKGFGDIDDQRVIQSLLAVRGGDISRDVRDEFTPKEKPEEWFEQTELALAKAIDFLTAEGIPRIELLPTTFAVPVLAAVFHLHPEMDTWSERLLARWLWRGFVHGYGRSGQTPALRIAVRAVNPHKGKPEKAPERHKMLIELLGQIADEEPTDFSDKPLRTDHANGRLALLAMLQFKPLDREKEPIDIASTYESLGAETVTELVPGRRSRLAARGFWPADEDQPTGFEDRRQLNSHVIFEQAAEFLRNDDQENFLAQRQKDLSAVIMDFLLSRVETGALVRPELEQLVVSDD